MSSDRCDVIVVGGGLAGLTAAYVLAGNGFEVMVLERANRCGEKSMSGGVLCGDSFRKVFGELCEEAPVERRIKRKTLGCVSGHSVISYDYCDGEEDGDLGLSILRVKFDQWLSEKAAEAGADMIVLADDV